MRKKTALTLDGAMRGIVGAMAMTGMRRVTTGLGLVEKTPPREMAEQARLLRGVLERLPRGLRDEAVELAHWSYGAVAGICYARLPDGFRRRRWSGPAYGLVIWAVFETGVVPLLGLEQARERTAASRILIAADHILYGAAVGGTPWQRQV
jgi:uncharacterized membrane protein YagU involved in acid resistance